MNKLFCILIFLTFSEFAFSQNEKYKVYPRDESNSDKTLFSFIQTLKQVCQEKDTSSLYELLDTGIVTSYGGDLIGKKDFINNWELQQPENSTLWNELLQVINLGGVFDSLNGVKYFCFPYAIVNDFNWFTELDSTQNLQSPFNLFICLYENVPVYKGPDKASEITGYLSYDIVLKDYIITQNQSETNASIDNWDFISTVDNKIKGWVIHKNIYNSIGPELIIRQINGIWKITHYCSYD